MFIFAGNFQLMSKESTGGLVILLRIASSWMSNPPEEWLFLPCITSSWRENPQKAWLFRRDFLAQSNGNSAGSLETTSS
jgi:hypothetical protein